jgi:hypothetical protein
MHRIVVICLIAISLTACGGGGAPTVPAPPSPVIDGTALVRPPATIDPHCPTPTATSEAQPATAAAIASRANTPVATSAIPFDIFPVGSPAATVAPIAAYDPSAWTFIGDSITDLGDYPEQVCTQLGCRPQGREKTIEYRPAILSTTLQRVDKPYLYFSKYALLASFKERVEAWPAGTVVVMEGVNDFYNSPQLHYTLDSWRAAWEEFYRDIDTMSWHPQRILLVGMPAVSDVTGCAVRYVPYQMRDAETAREAQDRITASEAAKHGSIYISLADMPASLLGPDRTHPSTDGQRYIVGKIVAALH